MKPSLAESRDVIIKPLTISEVLSVKIINRIYKKAQPLPDPHQEHSLLITETADMWWSWEWDGKGGYTGGSIKSPCFLLCHSLTALWWKRTLRNHSSFSHSLCILPFVRHLLCFCCLHTVPRPSSHIDPEKALYSSNLFNLSRFVILLPYVKHIMEINGTYEPFALKAEQIILAWSHLMWTVKHVQSI